MNLINKLLVPSSIVLLITACGGSDNKNTVDMPTDQEQQTIEKIPLNEDIISAWQSSCDDKTRTTAVFSNQNSEYAFSYEIATYDNDDCSDTATAQEKFQGEMTYVEIPSSGQVETVLQFDALQPASVLRSQVPNNSIEDAFNKACLFADYVGDEVVLNLIKSVVEDALKVEKDAAAWSDQMLDNFLSEINLPNFLPLSLIEWLMDRVAMTINDFFKLLLTGFKLFVTVTGDVTTFVTTLTVAGFDNICNGDISKLLYERRVMSAVSISNDTLYLSDDIQICQANINAKVLERWSHCATDRKLDFENPLTKVTN